jgi:dGTPase
VRVAPEPVAAFSPVMAGEMAALKKFLNRRMYRHPRVIEVMENAQKVLAALFGAFISDPTLLPKDWTESCGTQGSRRTARAVCDFIAGMTDRFALQEYRRVFHVEYPLYTAGNGLTRGAP